MKFTKRNHYNPCFWTALWSPDYYHSTNSGTAQIKVARKQVVYALSVKSGEIFKTKVESVHYDKSLGVAEITREAAEDFVRRYHPNQYDEFLLSNKYSEYPAFIDFEDILTAIEKLPPYQTLLRIAVTKKIDNSMDKANIGAFVALQCLRSHAVMNSMIDFHLELGRSKFEHFINLKWVLGDTKTLFNLVNPIVSCQWNLYIANNQSLPLCDSPILVGAENIMVALSPSLLLEINPNIISSEDTLPSSYTLSIDKYNEYRRRTIGNTFRELIGEQNILEQWRNTEEFRRRITLIKDIKSYNAMVLADGDQEIWQLNAYGNRS